MTALNPLSAQRIIDMTLDGLTNEAYDDDEWECILDDAAYFACDDFAITDNEFNRTVSNQARALINAVIAPYEQDPRYFKRVLFVHNEINSYDEFNFQFPGETKRQRELSIRKCFNEQSQTKHRKTIN
jgi:hypothetical protein